MKKKITLVVTCIVLVAAMVIGGTLAYFTDTKSAENTFTVGNVKIKLDEAVPGGDGERTEAGVTYTDITPGIAYGKDPVVTNTGKNDAYVRLIVTIENGMNWMGLYNDNVWTAPQEEAFMALINNTLGEDWTLEDIDYVTNAKWGSTDFVATLVYNKTLAPNEATSAAFTQVKLPEKATASDITTRITQSGTFRIDVVAQAIQTAGFEATLGEDGTTVVKTAMENAWSSFESQAK